ncbi:MAG: hypothetical protein C9356_20050, partial [Oleiphilus sp.]
MDNKVKDILVAAKDRKIPFSDALRELKTEVNNKKSQRETIAIIGMSGRFPGADTIDEFWNNLVNGIDSIRDVPESRWDIKSLYDPAKGKKGKIYSKRAGLLEDVDKFDPLFFNISPKEAKEMDPQYRLLLMEIWKSIEDSGYKATDLSEHKVGLFVAGTKSDYPGKVIQPFSTEIGRISYLFDWKGPCICIETTCSSGLVALHEACLHLSSNKLETAIVAGVNLMPTAEPYLEYSRLQALSEKGCCFAFDHRADGTVFSEAVCSLVLKPLSKAIQDKDQIYSVIKGSGINYDGKTNGITAPSGKAQSNLEIDIYNEFDIHPERIGLIEAHGTGTKLGDPVEANALIRSFKNFTDKEAFCALGSVKTNVGHAAYASGLVSLIKAALSIRHKLIPATLHFDKANKLIDWDNSPFYINTALESWESPLPRMAAVSAFGFSGTNAHVVLEEHPYIQCKNTFEPSNTRDSLIFPISAKSKLQLKQSARSLQQYLVSDPGQRNFNLADVSFTLQVGREEMEYRLCIAANSLEELEDSLRAYSNGQDHSAYVEGIAGSKLDSTFDDLELLLEARNLDGISRHWVEGGVLDWFRLRNDSAQRISLPTYPFLRESYWLEGDAFITNNVNAPLHPLIHRIVENTGIDYCYESTFTGAEEFLSEHRVKGQKVMPGSALLEMVCAAFSFSLGHVNWNEGGISFSNVVWSRPALIDTDELVIQVQLLVGSDGQASYKIISSQVTESGTEETIEFSSGAVSKTQLSDTLSEKVSRPSRGDLPLEIDSARIYEMFEQQGLDYGPSFRVLDEICSGETQIVASVNFPQGHAVEHNKYTIQPIVLDGIFQVSAIVGFGLEEIENSPALKVPFAINEVNVYAPVTSSVSAWIRFSGQSLALDEATRIDVDVFDLSGNLCLSIKGFTYRNFQSESKAAAYLDARPDDLARDTGLKHEEGVSPNNAIGAQLSQYLKQKLSKVLQIPVNRVKGDNFFEQYGVDSVSAMELIGEFEQDFGVLPKTLLFEYKTINTLGAYFVKEHSSKFSSLIGSDSNPDSQIHIREKPGNDKVGIESTTNHQSGELSQGDVAIIGLAGKYPGADSLADFWENLVNGKDSISEIPSDRWDWSSYYSESPSDDRLHDSKWGGFINDVDKFDPLFFNISPREAQKIDPQERLFLQTAWEVLEDAGYTPKKLAQSSDRSVGVYVGVMYEEYQFYGAGEVTENVPAALMGSPSSIANRVSHFFNLSGPSMAVDTMCSSSITAIQMACQDVLLGNTKLAIAGGVNLNLHPNKYSLLSQSNFMSSSGRCKSFGEEGDGYVPSEGVGAVLLKPLSKAISDGDRIYGVIKGGAINHGGKSNGFTVPNVDAQSKVIEKALDKANVNPKNMSYIEAHGTGTSLGDPIEISGLTKAFSNYTDEKQYCAIGSVKSNIGHCESASGIAALTKVLLQMKHGLLVPSIHAAPLNSNIEFDKSPFFVQQTVSDWVRPIVSERELPRVAGINAFGAGGSNAHLIVEEYIHPVGLDDNASNSTELLLPELVILSARSSQQLSHVVHNLIDFIKRNEDMQTFKNMVRTLQVGRQAFEERLAVIADSYEDLIGKLQSYESSNDVCSEAIYRGTIDQDDGFINVLDSDVDMEELVYRWIEKGEFHKVAELWIKGFEIEFDKLYAKESYRKICIPTYPFAKEICWPETSVSNSSLLGKTNPNVDHISSFVHRNTSTLSVQRYTSSFSGKETFLQDHLINNVPVLAGAVQIEMVRECVFDAMEIHDLGDYQLSFRNIVWPRALIITHQIDVNVVLNLAEDDSIEFEIYTEDQNATRVHCKGEAVFSSFTEREFVELNDIKHRALSAASDVGGIYRSFDRKGIRYGAMYQGIKESLIGNEEVLARITLPLEAQSENCLLHPGVLDSALQSAYFLDEDPNKSLAVPFELSELYVLRSLSQDMWVWVRPSEKTLTHSLTRLDIDLFDLKGKLCAQIRGLCLREVENATALPAKNRLIFARPSWRSSPVEELNEASGYSQRLLVMFDFQINESLVSELVPGVELVHLASKASEVAENLTEHSLILFGVIKEKLLQYPNDRILVQILTPSSGDGFLYSSLLGLLKTSEIENARVVGHIINLDTDLNEDDICKIVEENKNSIEDKYIRYMDGIRYVEHLEEIEYSEASDCPWKEEGVYLITGGLGGLGVLFAKEIIERTSGRASLILTGRSQLNEQHRETLESLRALGADVDYRRVDVTQLDDVSHLMDQIDDRFGRLNGVLHAAGSTNDSFIQAKSLETFKDVLAPKVTGTANLDLCSLRFDLDMFVLFSSLSGQMGNTGQADYAIANSFLDKYASYRSELVSQGKRKGRSLSVNWPLWKNGGMKVGETTARKMYEGIGMVPMDEKLGLPALAFCLLREETQILVAQGNNERLSNWLDLKGFSQYGSLVKERPEQHKILQKPKSFDSEKTFQGLLGFLKSELSLAIKLPEHRILNDKSFELYGVDSVIVTEVTSRLEKTFGSLPKTLFFEYQTISELSEYF